MTDRPAVPPPGGYCDDHARPTLVAVLPTHPDGRSSSLRAGRHWAPAEVGGRP
ncbi:hypothetical protein [Streptomyces leeuwenhoekii]|uniref:hypothetical protein n=1 Tax=Streptomyces leeuwenhoekii TaxID=1437453 RepID=UPI000ADFFDFC|nr:hypothetical protein [Streptomyces leeuwenhoekii]